MVSRGKRSGAFEEISGVCVHGCNAKVADMEAHAMQLVRGRSTPSGARKKTPAAFIAGPVANVFSVHPLVHLLAKQETFL